MDLASRVVIVTGASRGLGVAIATALASKGARLILAARGAEGLQAAVAKVEAMGGVAHAVPTDLADDADQDHLLSETERLLGPIDVLVNNAGLESIGRFQELPIDEIDQLIRLNLTVPMRMTRKVLPGMLTRGRGHIVNVASLAGLTPAAFGEAYVASKFGMVGFTRGLRASLREEGASVSASAICPGFVVGEGMFADQQRGFGVNPPRGVGSSTPEQVGAAVVRALERDLPEVIVNPGPMRSLLALGLWAPRLSEWLAPKIGANAVASAVVAGGGARPR